MNFHSNQPTTKINSHEELLGFDPLLLQEFLDMDVMEERTSNDMYSQSSSSSQDDNQSCMTHMIQQNNRYITTLLQTPGMTPHKLSVILKCQGRTEQSLQQKPKKRVRVLTSEQRKKKNFLRRLHPYPRLLKHDVRRDYMPMFINVMNSGDINLMEQFLHRYFISSCMFSKSSFFSKNKYQTIGREKLIDFYKFWLDIMSDAVLKAHNVMIRRNIETNYSCIIGEFKAYGTRTKFFQSSLVRMYTLFTSLFKQSTPSTTTNNNTSMEKASRAVKRAQSFDNNPIQTVDLSTMIIDDDDDDDEESNNNEIRSTKQNPYADDKLLSQKQVLDLNKSSYLIQLLDEMTPSNFYISSTLLDLFSILTPQKLFDAISSSLRDMNSLILVRPSFPGIQFEGDCIFYMYLNNQHQVINLEIYFKKVHLELSTTSTS